MVGVVSGCVLGIIGVAAFGHGHLVELCRSMGRSLMLTDVSHFGGISRVIG